MKLRCRTRWHEWSRWEPSGMFIDGSYGLDVPMREYSSHCLHCNKPRRMTLVDSTVPR